MDEKKIQIIKKLAFDMADKLKKNELSAFDVEYDDLKISVRRDAPTVISSTVVPAVPASQAPAVSTPEADTPAVPKVEEVAGNIVKSPIVGTFYKASSPESEPFVKIGSTVHKGDVLCIVEAMKMLNEIESEFEGEVTRILVADGEMVEFGQPIMVIE
jgi:acetyl-CoA carboxylase biotin carboxyl carrier protein